MATDTSPMRTVNMVHMADGTKEDYEYLFGLADQHIAGLPDRLMQAVRELEGINYGYKVSRLEHSLQSASRAQRDGRDEEYVAAALLHDIGDELAPWTHGEMTAAILKPFIPARICWIVKYHGLFQTYYYAHHFGDDRNARDRFKDHPYYADCIEFCEKYDQNCFDPAYASLPLEFFEPMVQRIFSQAPRFEQGDSF